MMKLIVLAAVVAAAYGAFSGDARTAQVLRLESDISPEGNYKYAYETENGISGQETGSLKSLGGTETPVIVAQGGYQFQSPEGQVVNVQYVADENGYQPIGDVLPTPPPTQAIPPAILRALEYIAAHPQPAEPVRKF